MCVPLANTQHDIDVQILVDVHVILHVALEEAAWILPAGRTRVTGVLGASSDDVVC